MTSSRPVRVAAAAAVLLVPVALLPAHAAPPAAATGATVTVPAGARPPATAPRAVTVTGTAAGSVSLAWTAPRAFRPARYRVLIRKGTAHGTVTVPPTSPRRGAVTLTGLAAAEHRFRVQAKPRHGAWGRPSAPVTATPAPGGGTPAPAPGAGPAVDVTLTPDPSPLAAAGATTPTADPASTPPAGGGSPTPTPTPSPTPPPPPDVQTPTAPTGVTVAEADSTLTLAWQPVSGATSYQARVVSPASGASSTVTLAGPSATVSGLINGTTYEVAVWAVNDYGPGPPTRVTGSPMTTATQPTPARAQYGDGQMFVSWNPPAQDGGRPVDRYAVTVSRPGMVPVTASAPPAARQAVVPGIPTADLVWDGGIDYTVTVSAVTAAGTGRPATTTTRAVPAPAPVPAAAAARGTSSTSLLVSWSPPPPVPGLVVESYQVQVYAADPVAGGVPLTALTTSTKTTACANNPARSVDINLGTYSTWTGPLWVTVTPQATNSATCTGWSLGPAGPWPSGVTTTP